MRCDSIVGVPRYYPVPVWRFVLFGLGSFGLYIAYWAYRNWRNIKRHDGSDIWPIPRAIFFGFTHFSLVADINVQLVAREQRLLSIAWPVLYILVGIAGRFAPDTAAWSLLLVVLSVLSTVPTLLAVRSLSGAAELHECATLRPRHWVGFVVCAMTILLMLLGLAGDAMGLPEE